MLAMEDLHGHLNLSSMPNDEEAAINFQLSPAYEITYQLVLVVGLFGNSLNLLVLSRRNLRGVSYIYLFWIALSDFVYLLLNALVYILEYLGPNVMFSYYPMFLMCRFKFAFGEMFCTSSAFILTVLSINRYCALFNRLQREDKPSRQRAVIVIISLFVLAICIYMPVIFVTDVREFITEYEENDPLTNHSEVLYGCEMMPLMDEPSYKIYSVVRELIARAVPIVVVTAFNIRIIFALREYWKNRMCSAEASNSGANEERQLIYLLIAIVIMFVTCTTPQAIAWIILSTEAHKHSYAYNVYDSICDMLVAINAACNFYLYCAFSNAFRRTFLSVLQNSYRKIIQKIGQARLGCVKRSRQMPNEEHPLASGLTEVTDQTGAPC